MRTYVAITSVLIFENQGQPCVVLLVDATERPDVQDLYRVHRLEGDGWASTEWEVQRIPQETRLILVITLHDPVQTQLCIPIPRTAATQPLLEAIHQTRRVFISTQERQAFSIEPEDQPSLYGLMIPVQPIPFTDLDA